MTDLRVDDFKSPDKPYQEETMETAERAQPVPRPWTGITEGRIVHVAGLPGAGGRCTAALVVRHIAADYVNLLLFPDGANDGCAAIEVPNHGAVYALPWVTSVRHETSPDYIPGQVNWHWPERA